MEHYKQKDITSDSDFKTRLQGYEEIKSYEELDGLPGSYVRYKLKHFKPNGSHETLYRLGGLCTHVDRSHEYITLKNPYAEKKGSYSNRWSVQLRYQMKKERGSNEAFYIPVVPKWQADKGENAGNLQNLINSSRHGVIIITIYSSKSRNTEKNEEISRLKELIHRLEKQDIGERRRSSPEPPRHVPVYDRPLTAKPGKYSDHGVKSKAFQMLM